MSMNVSQVLGITHLTGTHKHRFDEQGRGKGKFGRDSIPKGNFACVPNALEIYRRAQYESI